MRTTASSAILEGLASERRRVFADWRALVLVRRATFRLAPRERRWERLPQDSTDLTALFHQMQRRGEVRSLEGLRRIFEVTVPYASLAGPIDETEALGEVNPYAVLSHLTALAFHGLTEELPKNVTATISADTTGGLIPLGTEPWEWEGVELPGGRTPRRILGQPAQWVRVKPERFFGFAAYQPRGYPVRVTTLERTLLDGLLEPERSGGMANVLRAWALGRERLDIDVLVHQVERFGIAVLRQRVGYILDELGLEHPILTRWRQGAHRGGSSRLVAAAPYASAYSEAWSLSLNGPIHLLHETAS